MLIGMCYRSGQTWDVTWTGSDSRSGGKNKKCLGVSAKMYVSLLPLFLTRKYSIRYLYIFWSKQVIKVLVKLRRNASVLDQLDVACSFARFAHEQDLVRPILNLGYLHFLLSFLL